MSGKKTLVWVVILLALGAFYYYYEVVGEKTRQEATKQRELLVHVAAEAVTGLTLKHNQDIFRATKHDGRWLLSEPLATPGDAQKYGDFVRYVADLRYTRIIAEHPQNLAVFGLEPPAAELQVTLQDQSTPTIIRIGGVNPADSGYYAQVKDRPTVYLIGSAAKDILNASLYDVRDKTVLAFVPAEVQEIHLTHGAEAPVVLQRQDAEQWQMTAPVQAKADGQQVRTALQRLQNAKVKTFVAEETSDVEPYGLHTPTLRLTLVGGADRVQHTLVVGQESPGQQGVYAQRGTTSQVVLLGKDFWQGLPTSSTGWRDKTLLQYDRDHITRLEIQAPQSTIQVARTGTREYVLEQPIAAQGDGDAIYSVLWDLKELKAKNIVADAPATLAPYGLETPRLRLTAYEEQPNQPATQHTLLLGAEAAEGVYAMLPERPTVYSVDTSAAKRLLDITAFALQNKKILTFTPDTIEKIQVQYPDTRLVLERRGHDWRFVEPEKQAVSQSWKVDNLLRQLSTTHYAKIVAETLMDSSAYGFDTPQVQVQLWRQDGSAVGPLILGKTTETEGAGTAMVYAKVGATAPVYALQAAVLHDMPKTSTDWTTP